MTQKYVYGLPLYRQEQQLALHGIEISRQTMANWMIQGSERWLRPLYDRMRAHLLEKDQPLYYMIIRQPDPDALDELLPWSGSLPAKCRLDK